MVVTVNGTSISATCAGSAVSYSSSQHQSATKCGLTQYLDSGNGYNEGFFDNFDVSSIGGGGGGATTDANILRIDRAKRIRGGRTVSRSRYRRPV